MKLVPYVVLTCFFLLNPGDLQAYSFSDAVAQIKNHQSSEKLRSEASALQQLSASKSSLGDPMFKIAAKNYPVETLRNDQTPVTGLEFSISQKIPLTFKNGHVDSAYKKISEAKKVDAQYRELELLGILWKQCILLRKLEDQLVILKERKGWLDQKLSVTKELYSNGKTSQQAILEIHIRLADVESQIETTKRQIQTAYYNLDYLVADNKGTIDLNTVPWQLLNSQKEGEDLKEKSLTIKIEGTKELLTAQRLSVVPDVNVSVGYTKRADIDNNGDFVSAAVSFPLPVSGKRYSERERAAYELKMSENALQDYRLLRDSQEKVLTNEIARLDSELEIIEKKALVFARNARDITAKSYGLANTSYVEMLQSELTLQRLEIKLIELKAMKKMTQLSLKLLRGERLS